MKQGFLSSILLAAALSLGAGAAAAQPKEVKFGCYAPLTGQLAIFGKSMQQGFEMAIDDFEKSPQSKGIKFTIQCEDDQGRADDGINIATLRLTRKQRGGDAFMVIEVDEQPDEKVRTDIRALSWVRWAFRLDKVSA